MVRIQRQAATFHSLGWTRPRRPTTTRDTHRINNACIYFLNIPRLPCCHLYSCCMCRVDMSTKRTKVRSITGPWQSVQGPELWREGAQVGGILIMIVNNHIFNYYLYCNNNNNKEREWESLHEFLGADDESWVGGSGPNAFFPACLPTSLIVGGSFVSHQPPYSCDSGGQNREPVIVCCFPKICGASCRSSS